MARTIGLDVGNRRIGVAVSDTLKVIARPLEVIDRRQHNAVARIAQHAREQQADEIVVGYPWNADGTAGDQARRVEQFAQALRAQVEVPVRFYDERYSTGEAREILSAKKPRDKDRHDDAIAAAVILQRYLDESRAAANDDASDAPFGESEDEPDTA
jgi:putative holliday junction resolvase